MPHPISSWDYHGQNFSQHLFFGRASANQVLLVNPPTFNTRNQSFNLLQLRPPFPLRCFLLFDKLGAEVWVDCPTENTWY
jgi:hypothetical protein